MLFYVALPQKPNQSSNHSPIMTESINPYLNKKMINFVSVKKKTIFNYCTHVDGCPRNQANSLKQKLIYYLLYLNFIMIIIYVSSKSHNIDHSTIILSQSSLIIIILCVKGFAEEKEKPNLSNQMKKLNNIFWYTKQNQNLIVCKLKYQYF